MNHHKTPIEQRFWTKVYAPRLGMLLSRPVVGDAEDCWDWRGSTRAGYGLIWYENRQQPAHKVAWVLWYQRPFPIGMDACHTCDNPGCVNPLHVWPGTIRDNSKDAARKQRLPSGFNAGATACKKGHVYDVANTYHRASNGKRYCRACARARKESWIARHHPRAARAALEAHE